MKKLSKDEMKKIMGGYEPKDCVGSCDYNWKDYNGNTHTTSGYCAMATGNNCYCSNGVGSCS